MSSSNEREWIPVSDRLPTDGAMVATKIDDAQGCRNETTLKKQGNLWYFPDGSMYVYYRPTHWAEPNEDERRQHRERMEAALRAAQANYEKAR